MKESMLNEEYLDDKSFWHITNKLNLKSIAENGLVPRDGKRNGVSKSAEDPISRVFFSHGLKGVLEQANNLSYIINSTIKDETEIKRTKNGDDGKNIKDKMLSFLNNATNDNIKKNDSQNGGFIDLVNFLREEAFRDGLNEKLTEHDYDVITYDIVKTIWENSICLRANLKEGIDYSWDDTNFNKYGTKKVSMTQKNMHTFEGYKINTEALEVIIDEQGNPRTTWDVFKQMARYYKKENPTKDYLPVDEWESGYTNDEGQIVYTGEIKHQTDFLSMFMKFEEMEQSYSSKLVQNTEKNILEEKERGKTSLLESAIEATETSTRTEKINDQVIAIRKEIEQERTQENALDENDDNDNR